MTTLIKILATAAVAAFLVFQFFVMYKVMFAENEQQAEYFRKVGQLGILGLAMAAILASLFIMSGLTEKKKHSNHATRHFSNRS